MFVFERPNGLKFVALLGRTNVSGKTAADLDFLAEEGDGIYHRTRHVFGPPAADVFHRVTVETANLGLLYFDHRFETLAKLRPALELLNVDDTTSYVVFGARSHELGDGYITQVRFVSDFALDGYFEEDTQYPSIEKPLGMLDAMVAFVEAEIERFGSETQICDHFGIEVPFDGMWSLGFGFLVENSYYGIYRIWSRPIYYSK